MKLLRPDSEVSDSEVSDSDVSDSEVCREVKSWKLTRSGLFNIHSPILVWCHGIIILLYYYFLLFSIVNNYIEKSYYIIMSLSSLFGVIFKNYFLRISV